jgi:hypothetical protein
MNNAMENWKHGLRNAVLSVAALTTMGMAGAQGSASTKQDATQCVSQPQPMRHPNCPKGAAFGMRNQCAQPVDMRICIKQRNGGWDCGVSYGIAPGAQWSYPSCLGIYESWTDARSSGPSARRFNDPPK